MEREKQNKDVMIRIIQYMMDLYVINAKIGCKAIEKVQEL